MACSKNNSVIHVATFYNPKLFWFVYDEDIANRNLFNTELNNSSAPYPRISEPENGTIIAVKYGNNFVRAELICANTLKRNYTCWLIDYGIFTEFVDIYELPQKFKFQPAFAKKAMLYGLKPNAKFFDWENGGFVETTSHQWQDGVNKEIRRILTQPKIIQSFVKKCVYNDYVIGDIIIKTNQREICLTDMIAGLGLGEQDEASFNIEMISNEHPDLSLRDVFMSIGQKQEEKSCEPADLRKSPVPLSGWTDLRDALTEGSGTEYASCSSANNSDTETRPHPLPNKTFSVGRGKLRQMLMECSETTVNKEPVSVGVKPDVPVSSAGRGSLKAKLQSTLKQSCTVGQDEQMIFKDAVEKETKQKTSPVISAGRGNIKKMLAVNNIDLPPINTTETVNKSPENLKSAGRGFSKLFFKDMPVARGAGRGFVPRDSPKSSSENNSDDDSQFQDALKYSERGYGKTSDSDSSSCKSRKSSEKDLLPFAERNVKCDVLKYQPAGGQLTFRRKNQTQHRSSSISGNSSDSSTKYDTAESYRKSSNANFRATMHPKRPPQTYYSSDDSSAESERTTVNAPNCEMSKSSPSKTENLVTGQCECTTCKSWRSNVMVFKPHDIREGRPKLKKKTIDKPPLLFKTSEHQNDDIPGRIKSSEEFKNEMDKFTSPRLLVHGHLVPKPVDNLDIPFKPAVIRNLRYLKYVKPQRIQSYTWPAILRGNNVFVVNGPKSGKTMVYVPAFCHFLLMKQTQYREHVGPMGIVLCPGLQVARKVGKMMISLADTTQRSNVFVCVSPLATFRKNDSVKSARILICTPSTLIAVLKEKLIKLTRLAHVVLECANELFERFPTELETLFDVFQNVLTKRTSPCALQMIVVSQEWSHAIENLAKRLYHAPLICIGSYLEAAFYGRADIRVQFIESSAKSKKVIDILAENSKISKTVIVCNEIGEVQETLKYLETYGIDFLAVHGDSSLDDIHEVNLRWSAAERGNYFVVVCTDDILCTTLYLADASVVIQYSLPSSWTQFAFRFSTCIDNYKSPFVNNNTPASKVHIFVDESNSDQFIKMIQLLKRMGCNLSENILTLYKQYLHKLEVTKINNQIDLCRRIKMSGVCLVGSSCRERHTLSTELDLTNRLPKSGIVKLKLLHVDSVNRFYARLVEYIDADNTIHTVEDKYAEIAAQMLQLTDAKERKHVLDVEVDDMYFVKETEGIYRRCKVVKITKHGTLNRALSVVVRLIDTGAEMLVSVADLYLLPNSLKKIPPQAVEVYIANIGPPDKDTIWSNYCKEKLMTDLIKSGYQDSNSYFTGRIKLQLNNTIWVENLTLKEFLENGTLPVVKMSVRGFLLKLHLAEERREHLVRLYELCKKFGFNLPDYNLPVIHIPKPVILQSKPMWAHLENCEEYNLVNLITIQSPDSFFIKLCKNEKSFNGLIEDIDRELNKPFYPKICTVVEGNCYLAKDPEGEKYHRVLVIRIIGDQAECLFVDFGDYFTLPVADLKFLSNELIEQLPFQIIECKLWGIKPKRTQWPAQVTDFLYNFTVEPDSGYLRKLQVKIMDEEKPEITGYKKYSVILVNTFGSNAIINKKIADQGYAIQTDSFEIVDFEKLITKNDVINEQSDSNDEQSKGGADEENVEEIIRDNSSDESDTWDFQTRDAEKFLKEILKIESVPNNVRPATTVKKQITNGSKHTNTIALPPPGYSTPNVQWQQSDTHVIMKILLTDVTLYDIHVLRKHLLYFKTEHNKTTYRLDLDLYANVESAIEHEALGMYVRVKLKKLIPAEWQRLVSNPERLRNITYNAAHLPIEYDPDDDQMLPPEVFERAKEREDENQQGFVYEIGSDVDYSDPESDIVSGRESDDS